MEDIAPELLARIEQEFSKQFKTDQFLAELAAKLEAGTATHTEAYEYAGRVGEILTDTYQHTISSASLPDGKLWYNIANRVITPTMNHNYDIIAQYVTDVQTNLNKAAGLGIKAIQPDMNAADKIQGIVNRVSSESSYDDIQWILQEPVKTFGRSVVDASISANVNFQGKAGLTPKIVRKATGSCCKWCMALAGTYTYPDVPKDVYRRHDNCKCVVNYDPGKGKVQNVHSGKEGKRRYIQDEYGGYTKTKEARIAHAKEMAKTEEARKAAAREKRIAAWKKKDNSLENIAGSSKIKLSNIDVRKKYIEEVSQIPDNIDKDLPIEERAKKAFELRNRIRTEARELMADEETRERLDIYKPNKTFEELVVSKMERKGMTREEAIQDVYETATKTNADVNRELGIGGD